MTKEELINNGWKSELCKVGTLYFKDKLFCKFINEDTVDVRSYYDDLVSLGKAKTFEDINFINKKLLKSQIKAYQDKLNELIEEYNNLYKE